MASNGREDAVVGKKSDLGSEEVDSVNLPGQFRHGECYKLPTHNLINILLVHTNIHFPRNRKAFIFMISRAGGKFIFGELMALFC